MRPSCVGFNSYMLWSEATSCSSRESRMPRDTKRRRAGKYMSGVTMAFKAPMTTTKGSMAVK